MIVRIDDDQDRHLPSPLERSQLRAQPQAVEVLEVEIDDDELVVVLGRLEDRHLRIVDRVDVVPLADTSLDAVDEIVAVVDQQNLARSVGRDLLLGDADQAHGFARRGARAQLVGQHFQAHQALDPAEQCQIADRLGQEIVGTGLEPADPIVRLIQGGDHDDGDMLRLRSWP